MFTHMTLEFSDKIKLVICPKNDLCHKFAERKCFMIIISCTCINSTVWKDCKSSILFGRFNLEASTVCKALMKGSHNLLVYVNVPRMLEDQVA